MKRFKTPLIATGIVFLAMIVCGAILITVIYSSSGSRLKKLERASMAGAGVATLGGVIIAPFWLVAAAKIGQERRRNKR